MGDDAGLQDRTILPAVVPIFPSATAHRTALAVGQIALFECLAILAVSTRYGSPGWLQGLAVLAVVATGLVWYRGYRRRRYGGWDGVVDAAAVFLITLTALAMPLTAGVSVLIARTLLRTMSGSLPTKLAHSTAGFACLATALGLTGPQEVPIVHGLIATGLGLLALTLSFDRFWRTLDRNDRLLQHRLVLARASHQLAAGGDHRRISEVILAAATSLTSAGDPVRAVVAVGPADRLTVRAATDDLTPAVGAALRYDGGRLRPMWPGQPQARPIQVLLEQPSTAVSASRFAPRTPSTGCCCSPSTGQWIRMCVVRWSGCAAWPGRRWPLPR